MPKPNAHITVRKVRPDELQILQIIGSSTFEATYGALNTEENMRQYLAEHFCMEAIKTSFENPEEEFYFAENSGHIIGYVKLNHGSAQTEDKFPNTLEIERIYVIAEHQRKGYGLALLEEAIGIASKKGYKSIWLGVWDRNAKAINFYEKNGFSIAGIHPFVLGTDPQRDYLMKLEL